MTSPTDDLARLVEQMDALYRASLVSSSRSTEHAHHFTVMAYQHWPALRDVLRPTHVKGNADE